MNFEIPTLISVATAFLAAWLAAHVIVVTQNWHGRLSMDSEVGVQKFHTRPTPRVGGVALMMGLGISLLTLEGEVFSIMGLLLVCSSFSFAAGLIEDVSKSVRPRYRLLAALISGLVFVLFSGSLQPLASPLVPAGSAGWVGWMIYGLGGAGIAFGLAGTTNAINIIDGFHGLASGTLIIISLTIAGLAFVEGDAALVSVSLVFAAAVAGFMVVNFPNGHLFLGDAGAYTAGFIVGALAVLLAARTDVSAFVSILIMAYPVYETLFSIRRKSRRIGHTPSQPDSVHLHMLVSRRYARFIAYGIDRPDLRNAITGVLMWPFSIIASILAVFAQGTSVGGVLGLAVFALFYGRIYKLVSLQRPSFMQKKARAWGWDESERFKPSQKPESKEE